MMEVYIKERVNASKNERYELEVTSAKEFSITLRRYGKEWDCIEVDGIIWIGNDKSYSIKRCVEIKEDYVVKVIIEPKGGDV